MREIDDKAQFLTALNSRMRQIAGRVKEGDLVETFASFELLASLFSAQDAENGSICPDELAASFPVADWRENRVEVPRALLRPIVDAWKLYRENNVGVTLGEAMGLEGGGSGKKPISRIEATRDRNIRLSNQVVVDLIASKLEGHPISQDAAFQLVAEKAGVNYETVRKAFKASGNATIKKLQEAGVKTSTG